MSARDFDERDIHLALDGELPDDDRPGYEKWLDANPGMKSRAERFADDVALLRASVASVVDEPLPTRFTHQHRSITGVLRPFRRKRWRIAAAAALLAVGLIGGFLAGASGWLTVDPQAFRLADSAIAAHNIYAAEKLHVVEVGVDQKDHLQKWLSNRLGMPLAAPDLSSEGYVLIGGRLLPAGAKSAAQLMYEDPAGNRVSLYVAHDETGRETGFRFLREGGTRAVFWLDEGYGCAVAGVVPDALLTRIADVAYRQLLGDADS